MKNDDSRFLEDETSGSSAVPEKKPSKKWLWIGGGTLLAAITAVAIGASLGGEPEPRKTVTQTATQTTSTKAPVTAEPTKTVVTKTTSSASASTMATAEVKQFSEKDIESLSKTLLAAKSADDARKVTTDALGESLERVDMGMLTNGITLDDISQTEGGFKATFKNAKGDVAYTANVDVVENEEGDRKVFFESIDMAEQGRRLDKDGFPVPAPITPLSSSQIEAMSAQSFEVAKAYIEHTGDQSDADRAKRLKDLLRGGDFSDFRPRNAQQDARVSAYAPLRTRMLTSAYGDDVVKDRISVGLIVQYADVLGDQKPWEELDLAVDYAWDEQGKVWYPAGLRMISAQPLISE